MRIKPNKSRPANKCFDHGHLSNPSCWLVLKQRGLTWDVWIFPSTGIWRERERAVVGELLASDSCSRSLALMSVWCLESWAHVKPRLRPGSDWWSSRHGYCGAVFAPLNEARGQWHCLALRLPFLSPQDPTLCQPRLQQRPTPLVSCLFPRLLKSYSLVIVCSNFPSPFLSLLLVIHFGPIFLVAVVGKTWKSWDN